MKLLACLLFALALPFTALADLPEPGVELPPFTIDNMGLLVLEGEDISHVPFELESVRGRPIYLQHLAARVGLDETYQPLSDVIEERFDPDTFFSVAIINRDDAAFGTGFIVTSTLKSNKRRYPDANIVVDGEGKILQAWDLQPKSAAVMILDAEGTVLFFKEGALTESEQSEVIDLLDSAINSVEAELVK